MNIGIDFNTEVTRGCFIKPDSENPNPSKVYEVVNGITFVGDDMLVGSEAIKKYLASKKATYYELRTIEEVNGLVINRRQVGVDRCLALLFGHLIERMVKDAKTTELNALCVSIPYSRYYYWHEQVYRAFSLLGVKLDRIVPQPTAFLLQTEGGNPHEELEREATRKRRHEEVLANEEEVYKPKPSFLSRVFGSGGKLEPVSKFTEIAYLFIVITNDNVNLAWVIYGEGVLEARNTHYTTDFTERDIEDEVLKFFVEKVEASGTLLTKDDEKTMLRLKEAVDEYVKSSTKNSTYKKSIPKLLNDKGKFFTAKVSFEIGELQERLQENLNRLLSLVHESIPSMRAEFNKSKQQKQSSDVFRIDRVVVVGESVNNPAIQNNLIESLHSITPDELPIFATDEALSEGAANYSKVMSGHTKDMLALEVCPYSVQMKIGGSVFDVLPKDTTVPSTRSLGWSIKDLLKMLNWPTNTGYMPKFLEVHLTTAEGESAQSLSIWRVELEPFPSLFFGVDIDANNIIRLAAEGTQENFTTGKPLQAQQMPTFSFQGSAMSVGFKGRDLRTYVRNQFSYLSAALGERERGQYEPSERLYSDLAAGKVDKALKDIAKSLKLASLPKVELIESEIFAEMGAVGFIKGDTISLPQRLTDNPHALGYVLAHELSHYVLMHLEGIILEDEQENEILTEMFVIYSGLGKLFLNGFNSKDAQGITSSAGYLNQEIINLIHELYFEKFNIDEEEYIQNLTEVGVQNLSLQAV